MGANRIQNLSPSELTALALQMKTALVPSVLPSYGINAGTVEYLSDNEAALVAASAEVEATKAAYHAAVQSRLDVQASLVGAVSLIARTVYANHGVSSNMIAALGLSPRSTSRAKIVPQTPTDLVAALLPSGSLSLRWTGNNAYGVVYRVEAQVGSDPAFRFVTETTAQKASLSGFAAGVSVGLRVVASKNGALSDASPVAIAYYAPPAVTLRLAA